MLTKVSSVLSLSLCLLLCIGFLSMQVTAVPLPLPTTTYISCGNIPTFNYATNTWYNVPYCSITTMAVASLEDPTLWVTPLSYSTNSDGSYHFTSASPWVKNTDQVSLDINGTLTGSITGDAILVISPSDWSKFANYANAVNYLLTNAASNTLVELYFVFVPVTSSPNLYIDPSWTETVVIEVFEYAYFTTIDPVLKALYLLQLTTWASANGRTDVSLDPVVTSLEAVYETVIFNVHRQATLGLKRRSYN
jgi:hypothetical protein